MSSFAQWKEKYGPFEWLLGATDPSIWKSRYPSQFQIPVIVLFRCPCWQDDCVRISYLQVCTKEENKKANIRVLCLDCNKKDRAFRSSIEGQGIDFCFSLIALNTPIQIRSITLTVDMSLWWEALVSIQALIWWRTASGYSTKHRVCWHTRWSVIFDTKARNKANENHAAKPYLAYTAAIKRYVQI